MNVQPRPQGTIKTLPEDFVVEEMAAYAPSGEGTHVFVRFTKTNLTTLEAVRAISQRMGCNPRDAGVAGMKDKRAVTTQSISLQIPHGIDVADFVERARHLELEGIRIQEVAAHGHKLRAGHLAGNRFDIVVRGIPSGDLTSAADAFERIAREGLPNAFGPQRFGRDGDNPDRALAWLRGQERGPGDPRLRRLLWSSVQSLIFNAVLDARVEAGTWATPLQGDLLKIHETGGLFPCTEPDVDGKRALAGEVSPTGPILGARMRAPEGQPAIVERATADRLLGPDFDLSKTRALGEGSRRPLRIWVSDLRWEPCPETQDGKGPACVRVHFMLPKGAYATTVLGAAFALSHASDRASSEPEDGEPNRLEEQPE